MSKLVIVESPAKAKTIQKYLGKNYSVIASMGHIRDLPKSKFGVDVEHGFVPQYQEIKGKEELISELKSAARKADTVYLATARTAREKRFPGIWPRCSASLWISPTA